MVPVFGVQLSQKARQPKETGIIIEENICITPFQLAVKGGEAVDSTGGIGKQVSSSDFALSKKKDARSLSEQPAQSVGDSFKETGEDSQYIIIPPPIQPGSGKGLFKSVSGHLDGMDVKVDNKLPVIGGYVARLDDEKKKELSRQGFMMFEDKEENWLPSNPAKKALEEALSGKDPKPEKPDEAAGLKERPKLTEPRFDTPLTRQFTGKGITIAVIDSGIYPHPDFLNADDKKNRILDFVDFVNNKRVPYDDNGHGTHVAGDAAGSGLMSDGIHKGSAPEASIVALKALSGSGSGSTSNIIKAIQWCIQNKEKYNIRVINMSLGHTAQKDYFNDPTNMAVKAAYESGIVVVAAAGNEGPDPQTIGAPGDSPHAISVGAADDYNTPRDKTDDTIADFSSRGPTVGGLMKPDMVAPGEAIVAPFSPGTEESAHRSNNLFSTIKWMYQMPDEAISQIPPESLKLFGFADSTIERWMQSPKQAKKEMQRIFKAVQKTPIVDDAYVGMPGTSMASPRVAGVVAQVIQANPNLKPGEVAQILKQTAEKMAELPETDQGSGMINPHDAIQMALDVKDGKLAIIPPRIEWPPDNPPEEAPAEAKKE